MLIRTSRANSNVVSMIVLSWMMCMSGCCQNPGNARTAKAMGPEYQKRVEVFEHMYRVLISQYAKDGILDLPADYVITARTTEVPAFLNINKEPIELGPKAKHTVLLSDHADIGDGSARVILFADGHVEISTVVK